MLSLCWNSSGVSANPVSVAVPNAARGSGVDVLAIRPVLRGSPSHRVTQPQNCHQPLQGKSDSGGTSYFTLIPDSIKKENPGLWYSCF